MNLNRSNTPISPSVRKLVAQENPTSKFYQAILELPDEDLKSSLAITESQKHPVGVNSYPLTFDNRKIIIKDPIQTIADC